MNCPDCEFDYDEEDFEGNERRCVNCGRWLAEV